MGNHFTYITGSKSFQITTVDEDVGLYAFALVNPTAVLDNFVVDSNWEAVKSTDESKIIFRYKPSGSPAVSTFIDEQVFTTTVDLDESTTIYWVNSIDNDGDPNSANIFNDPYNIEPMRTIISGLVSLGSLTHTDKPSDVDPFTIALYGMSVFTYELATVDFCGFFNGNTITTNASNASTTTWGLTSTISDTNGLSKYAPVGFDPKYTYNGDNLGLVQDTTSSAYFMQINFDESNPSSLIGKKITLLFALQNDYNGILKFYFDRGVAESSYLIITASVSLNTGLYIIDVMGNLDTYTDMGTYFRILLNNGAENNPELSIVKSGWFSGSYTDENLACFLHDTLILTPTGEQKVQNLKIGDLVVDINGQPRPITDIYRDNLFANRHPVLVKKDHFGPGRPHADLYLSPEHAIYLGQSVEENNWLLPMMNKLLFSQPIMHGFIKYYNLKLDSFDASATIYANGLLCEAWGGASRTHVMHVKICDWKHERDPDTGLIISHRIWY